MQDLYIERTVVIVSTHTHTHAHYEYESLTEKIMQVHAAYFHQYGTIDNNTMIRSIDSQQSAPFGPILDSMDQLASIL